MTPKTFVNIFRNGSTTYFYSSIFFPEKVRQDVFVLYSFVRTADDFVDSIPQQKKAFREFREMYNNTRNGTYNENEIITAFVELMKRKQFDPKWVEAFLDAMEQDLTKTTYKTIKETEAYMYGSAEVIGLFMAQIMDLPHKSHTAARYLGKAMQFINFIRDIEEDTQLGRTYLPTQEIHEAGLSGIRKSDAIKNQLAFEHFIINQLTRYETWQQEAEKGFQFIPKRYLIPIQTASDMYNYTAQQIRKNPFIVFERKVKPSKYRIIQTGIKNAFFTQKL